MGAGEGDNETWKIGGGVGMLLCHTYTSHVHEHNVDKHKSHNMPCAACI